MVESETYRFGKIDLPSGELPSAEELRDAIENSDKSRVRDIRDDLVEDEEIKLRERGINPYYSQKPDSHSFCQFTYRGDRENSTTTWDGISSDTDTEADDTPVQPLVFYFDTVNMLTQPRIIFERHGYQTLSDR